MAFNVTSYFAGAATVIATVAIGFGGGVLLADALVGTSEKAPSLVMRRASETTQPIALAVAAQGRVNGAPVLVEAPGTPAPVTAPPIPSTVTHSTRPPDEAFARARDAELQKVAAAEKRKAQRRKWAERRRQDRKRVEQQQITERKGEFERSAGRPAFAESPRVNIFGDD